MGIFKAKKNKRFGYEPRYYKSDREGYPFQIEGKFDKFRKTTGETNGLKGKLVHAWEDLKNNSDKKTNKVILIIIFLLMLLFLFIIDFDLSIFTQALF